VHYAFRISLGDAEFKLKILKQDPANLDEGFKTALNFFRTNLVCKPRLVTA